MFGAMTALTPGAQSCMARTATSLPEDQTSRRQFLRAEDQGLSFKHPLGHSLSAVHFHASRI